MFSRPWHHLLCSAALVLAWPICALAADATFSWLPNTEPNLAGYKIHFGTSSGVYGTTIDVGQATLVNGRVTATVTGLSSGANYYFVATAYDTTGGQSGYSTEVMYATAEDNSQPPPPANSKPTAEAGAFAVQQKSTFEGLVEGTDADNDPLTFAVVTPPQHGTLTLNTDGSFSYTPANDASTADSFSFAVQDGQLQSEPATVSITIEAVASLPMEVGEVLIDHIAVRVPFEQRFTQPVVVANQVTRNGPDPCVIRVSNVDPSGFTMHLQEYEYLDGRHTYKETISYMVMEKGTHTLDDGTRIEAGSFETEATTTAATQSFAQAMAKTPIVLTTVASMNESQPVAGRVSAVTTSGFKYQMQEQEKNVQSHARETVAYIAWEPGSGVQNGMRYEAKLTGTIITNKIVTTLFSQAFTDRPFVLAAMQTINEKDTAIMRIKSTLPTTMAIFVEEEKSYDKEVIHAKEQAGYLAILTE